VGSVTASVVIVSRACDYLIRIRLSNRISSNPKLANLGLGLDEIRLDEMIDHAGCRRHHARKKGQDPKRAEGCTVSIPADNYPPLTCTGDY
jgi:hypothetical protein